MRKGNAKLLKNPELLTRAKDEPAILEARFIIVANRRFRENEIDLIDRFRIIVSKITMIANKIKLGRNRNRLKNCNAGIIALAYAIDGITNARMNKTPITIFLLPISFFCALYFTVGRSRRGFLSGRLVLFLPRESWAVSSRLRPCLALTSLL